MLRTNLRQKPQPAQLLANLPVGALVIDANTTYCGERILWRIADKNHPGYPANSITLITEKVLSHKAFDAKEPLNPIADCVTKGNCRYTQSNIRLWANSAAGAGEWYSARHEHDSPPVAENLFTNYNPYVEEAGFLNTFSAKFVSSMLLTNLTVLVADKFGGGEEQFCDKIFIPSMAEVGIANYMKIDEGTKLAIFSDNASRLVYPTPSCISSSQYTAATLAENKPWMWWLRSPYGAGAFLNYVITVSGSSTTYQTHYGVIGFRPLCNLPGAARVSLTAGSDGAYQLFV